MTRMSTGLGLCSLAMDATLAPTDDAGEDESAARATSSGATDTIASTSATDPRAHAAGILTWRISFIGAEMYLEGLCENQNLVAGYVVQGQAAGESDIAEVVISSLITAERIAVLEDTGETLSNTLTATDAALLASTRRDIAAMVPRGQACGMGRTTTLMTAMAACSNAASERFLHRALNRACVMSFEALLAA